MATTGPLPAFPATVRGCLFDLDGVLTSTARLHAQAWKATFDDFLAHRDPQPGEDDDPFDIATDYREYLDGRLREDGVHAFLASRHIALPEGSPGDPLGQATVHTLAASKNERLLQLMAERGVGVFPGSVELVRAARAADLRTAVVSASANTKAVLASAGITDLFDVVVDGIAAAERHLAGKPSPQTYLAAASDLNLAASESRSSKTPSRASRLGGQAASPSSSVSTATATERSFSRMERPSSSTTSRSSRRGDSPPELPSRAVVPAGDCARPRCPGPERVALHRLQRPHRPSRQPRRGRSEHDPGDLPQLGLRARPLPYGEAGYGDPESSESIINVTNGKILRLLVDDEPFDVRYGTVLDHERCLDFRAGTLTRTVTWRSPADATVRVRTVRLVSLSQRSVAAIRYEVEAVDTPVRVVLQSELVANEFVPEVEGDPQVAAALERPLVAEEHECDLCRALLVHRTKQSKLRVAAAMDHEVDGPEATTTESESIEDVARVTVTSELAIGERLQLTKYLSYGWSAVRSRPASRPGTRRTRRGQGHRLGRAGERAAHPPRQLLERGGRGARRR